jgi:hypothetical protein
MADWGLYTALRGQDDWKQKRQDQQYNLMIAEKRSARAEQQMQEQAKIEQGLIEYFNEFNKLDVTPEDAERIRQKEAEERNNIVKGIGKFGGDVKKFMASGGATALANYKNNVMLSQEVQTGLQNKAVLNDYIVAKKEGKWIGKVAVEIPTDQVDEQGRPLMQQKMVTPEEQYGLYKQGVIKSMAPITAEKRVTFQMLDFNRTVKDPANPYSKNNMVTMSDVYNQARTSGASHEQAKDLANDYTVAVEQGGQPRYWGAKDQLDAMLKQAKINDIKSRISARNTASNRLMVTDAETNALKSMSEGQQLPISPGAVKVWGDIFKATPNKDGTMKFHQPVMAHDGLVKDKSFDLSKAKSVVPVSYYKAKDANGNMRTYLKAKATYEDENYFTTGENEKNTPIKTSWGTTNLVDDRLKNNWQVDGDNYTGMVDIPIDNLINDKRIAQSIGIALNFKTNFSDPATFGTTEGYNQYNAQQVLNLMQETGMSWEEMQGGLMQNYEDDSFDDQ